MQQFEVVIHTIFVVCLCEVAYEIQGPPRSLLEAAATEGFMHVSTDAMHHVLHDIGEPSTRPHHVKAAAILKAYRQEWQWSDIDIARAMSFVLLGRKHSQNSRSSPPARNDDFSDAIAVWQDLVQALESAEGPAPSGAVHNDDGSALAEGALEFERVMQQGSKRARVSSQRAHREHPRSRARAQPRGDGGAPPLADVAAPLNPPLASAGPTPDVGAPLTPSPCWQVVQLGAAAGPTPDAGAPLTSSPRWQVVQLGAAAGPTPDAGAPSTPVWRRAAGQTPDAATPLCRQSAAGPTPSAVAPAGPTPVAAAPLTPAPSIPSPRMQVVEVYRPPSPVASNAGCKGLFELLSPVAGRGEGGDGEGEVPDEGAPAPPRGEQATAAVHEEAARHDVFGCRAKRLGVDSVHFAPSGRSKCRLCKGLIALGSVRFTYWWHYSRPATYIHPPCIVTSELPKASLITGLLDLVVPQDSEELRQSVRDAVVLLSPPAV